MASQIYSVTLKLPVPVGSSRQHCQGLGIAEDSAWGWAGMPVPADAGTGIRGAISRVRLNTDIPVNLYIISVYNDKRQQTTKLDKYVGLIIYCVNNLALSNVRA